MKAALLLLLLFPAPAPAMAAPTCQDRGGNTARCGTENAMPLGWKAPEADRHFAPADRQEIARAVIMVILLLALIGLLPDFDGARWDRQEGDPEDKE